MSWESSKHSSTWELLQIAIETGYFDKMSSSKQQTQPNNTVAQTQSTNPSNGSDTWKKQKQKNWAYNGAWLLWSVEQAIVGPRR